MPRGASFVTKVALLCLLTALVMNAQAPRPAPDPQSPADRPGGMGAPPSMPGKFLVGVGDTTLVVQVFAEERGASGLESMVTLRSEMNGWENYQTIQFTSEVTFPGLAPGVYSLEVSAVGYRTAVERLDIDGVRRVLRATITLKRDPTGSQLSATPVSLIPRPARKDTERGLVALRSKKLKDAEKYLLKAYKRAPESADLNYLLGVLFSQKNDFAQAQSYLAKAATIDARHVRALTALGGVLLQQNDCGGAIKNLQQAISVDPQYWLAHWLLANGFLKQKEFEKARNEAQLAVETGKGAANAAQLSLGEAWAGLGRSQEAIAALEGYLRDMPASPAAPQVRQRIAQLKLPPTANASLREAAAGPQPSLEATVSAPPEARLSLPNWEPPGIDDVRPPVAAGVTCPERQVIAGATQRVLDLVADIARFESREEVIHEDLDELGTPRTRESRTFSYVATFSRPAPGVPSVSEYRIAASGSPSFPQRIATLGLPTLAFVFHPDLRDNYTLTCEGLGEWQGQATWLVHFRQREDRPSRLMSYIVGPEMHVVDQKGRAWIAASTFHIVHMEAELVRPVLPLRLLTQHQIVDYGLVNFANKNTALWLPTNAELYFHFQGHRFHRRHKFDRFRLFSVDATQQVSPTNSQQ